MKTLYEVASAMQAIRRRRDALFGRDLFGEPAWDILLDLYIAEHSGRPLALSTVGALAGVPQTTAFRWMTQLLDRGLIVRSADPNDARRGFIRLSQKGQTLLKELLERAREDWSPDRTSVMAGDRWAAAIPKRS